MAEQLCTQSPEGFDPSLMSYMFHVFKNFLGVGRENSYFPKSESTHTQVGIEEGNSDYFHNPLWSLGFQKENEDTAISRYESYIYMIPS